MRDINKKCKIRRELECNLKCLKDYWMKLMSKKLMDIIQAIRLMVEEELQQTL